jgi:sulfite reductase (ferredoxin)
MPTFCRLPDSFAADLLVFRQATERFQAGELSSSDYRSIRVPRGIYEQRQAGTFMVRVRLPAGTVFPDQMRVLARLARQFGNGALHVTTRQDLQIHGVLLGDLPAVLGELHAVGLSSRGGGGNTVRNVTSCPQAGVCPSELFDVTPWVLGLTELLLAEPLSFELPRKFKIAVSGCGKDCAGATVADLGLIAKQRGATQGFAVYVGGGLGGGSRVAKRLEEFVPAEEIHLVVEAVKRVFAAHGDRQNRHKARLRFLLGQLGLADFRGLYEAQLAELRQARIPDSPTRELPAAPASRPSLGSQDREGFGRWRERNAILQKQAGYFLVQIPLVLGHLEAAKLDRLAQLAAGRGNGTVRASLQQGLALPWIPEPELADLHAELAALGLADAPAPILRNLVSCTGAATCKLGLCRSRDLAHAIRAALGQSGLNLDEFGELRLYVSGCPNCCGRHPIADVGLCGAVRNIEGRAAPHYLLQLGGRVGETQTRLAQGKLAAPAKNVPALVVALLARFRQSPQWPDFARFLDAQGQQLAESLAAEHQRAPTSCENGAFFIDWGATEPFVLAEREGRKCGASAQRAEGAAR